MEAGLIETTRAEALLAWFNRSRRDLPWRNTRDPWAVLVSETMLQQTQVDRVVPKFEAFMNAFPTVDACASASVGEVVRLWDGLGYNRRALFLHRAACVVVDEYGGHMPSSLNQLLSLPGVGPYTARAVLVFAFEISEGVLDTNVSRVLARAVAGRTLAGPEAQQLATDVVPLGDAWAWNQAMLDLGAGICRKRKPLCTLCPISTACAWLRSGALSPDPALGSAGASMPQTRFAGSDREGRGRIVKALRSGTVPLRELPVAAGWPGDYARTNRVLQQLLLDGLVVSDGVDVSLPTH